MKTTALFAFVLAASLIAVHPARADFSYTMTMKATGGTMASFAGAAANRTSHYFLKGSKMKSVNGDTSVIIDFDAQTVTTVNDAQKTYTVKKFSDINTARTALTDLQVDVKTTGQKKNINGYDASEVVLDFAMDADMGRGPAMKMQMSVDLWISSDPPGAKDQIEFFHRNAAQFPWKALSGAGGNPSIERAMEQMQQKLAEMNGVVVEQVMRMNPAGGSQVVMPTMPKMTPEQMAQMQAAMAKMQEMAKQGGPQADAAKKAMAAMGGMAAGGAPGTAAPASGGALLEMTSDATGFSSAAIPDATFAIPGGYKQAP